MIEILFYFCPWIRYYFTHFFSHTFHFFLVKMDQNNNDNRVKNETGAGTSVKKVPLTDSTNEIRYNTKILFRRSSLPCLLRACRKIWSNESSTYSSMISKVLYYHCNCHCLILHIFRLRRSNNKTAHSIGQNCPTRTSSTAARASCIHHVCNSKRCRVS